MIFKLVFIALIGLSLAAKCKPPLGKCNCGVVKYIGRDSYVVNCTGTDYKNASVLKHLPEEVEILLFTGNDVPSLPCNIFGITQNYTKLRVIDMSNNKIQEILGKTFHRVSKVERLILNHNELSFSYKGVTHHPRLFSNFESLMELHLTKAFAVNSSTDLAKTLHDIFINSDLKKLKKLHLEQNDIAYFKDRSLFCDLPSLMDIYLSNNKLKDVGFEFECLRHLRYINLESNAINVLSPSDLHSLDMLPARKQNITVNLSKNPFTCGCEIEGLYKWLQFTKVDVPNKNKLKCKHGANNNQYVVDMHSACSEVPHNLRSPSVNAPTSSFSGTVQVLSLALFLSICLLIYTNRNPIRNKASILQQVLTRKANYTFIEKQEAREMEV